MGCTDIEKKIRSICKKTMIDLLDCIDSKVSDQIKEAQRMRIIAVDSQQLRREASRKRNKKIKDEAQQWLAHTKTASFSDYMDWFAGYIIKSEARITHYYDYDFLVERFRVLTQDAHITPLYGANSVRLIIPCGVKVTYDDLGHSDLYFMKNHEMVGDYVPSYSNMVVDFGFTRNS